MQNKLDIAQTKDILLTNYLVDFFILKGALFNEQISTFQSNTMDEVIKKMRHAEKDIDKELDKEEKKA